MHLRTGNPVADKAALLAAVMEINARALRERQPQAEALRRYQTVARVLTGKPGAEVGDGIRWVAELCRELQIPGLGTYKVNQDDFGSIVVKAEKASSMKANPIALTREELAECLARSV